MVGPMGTYIVLHDAWQKFMVQSGRKPRAEIMGKDRSTEMFPNIFDAEARIVKPSSAVKLDLGFNITFDIQQRSPTVDGKNKAPEVSVSLGRRDYPFAHIKPILSNALGGAKKVADEWKSVSRSVLQLLGFDRRQVEFTISSWKPLQGETLAVMISVPPINNLVDRLNVAFRKGLWKDSFVEVICERRSFPAYPTSGCADLWRALIPLTPLDTSGPRSITVDIKDGKHKPFDGVIEVVEKEYSIESIWLSEDKSTISGTKKELDAINKLVSRRTAEQYWHGPFKLPTHGRVTTDYGLKRYYNGIFASGYYHQGIDYGAPRGSPVVSPSAARVSLVGREDEGFALHGNCVGLDHGHGVTSILMHLDTIFVQEGMIVRDGDSLGTIGDTGLATGPHLHWGLYVHGKAVDPKPWLKEQAWI